MVTQEAEEYRQSRPSPFEPKSKGEQLFIPLAAAYPTYEYQPEIPLIEPDTRVPNPATFKLPEQSAFPPQLNVESTAPQQT